MAQTANRPTDAKPTPTPEERAAKRLENQTKRSQRDVVRSLDAAQTCLRRASSSVALGKLAEFRRWMDAAVQAMQTADSLASALSPEDSAPTA